MVPPLNFKNDSQETTERATKQFQRAHRRALAGFLLPTTPPLSNYSASLGNSSTGVTAPKLSPFLNVSSAGTISVAEALKYPGPANATRFEPSWLSKLRTRGANIRTTFLEEDGVMRVAEAVFKAVSNPLNGGLLLRIAFHECGTFDYRGPVGRKGGCNGSIRYEVRSLAHVNRLKENETSLRALAIKKIDRVACLSLSLSLPLSRPPFSPFVPLPLQTVRLGQQRRRVFLCLGVMSGDAGAAVFWRVGVERDEKEKNARSSPPPLLFCSRKKKNTEQASSASAIPLCGQEGRSPTLSSEQTRSPLGTPR